jgi:hypothetical protein
MIRQAVKEYLKTPIVHPNLPWKLGGLAAWPQEREFKAFLDYRRFITEEVVEQQIRTLEGAIKANGLIGYQGFMEAGLARDLYKEMYPV